MSPEFRIFVMNTSQKCLKFGIEEGIGKNHVSRKDAKTPSENELSFRPKGEIFLRSLTVVRDDCPSPPNFAPLRLGAINFLAVVLFNISKARILFYSKTGRSEYLN